MNYQIAIIGAGPAGYTAAEAAAGAGLSVVLFEKNNLGGVCLNEGCIPTKTLLYAAKTYDAVRHASGYGITAREVCFDLPKIISRKTRVVRKLVLGIKARLAACGVEVVTGAATLTDTHTLVCNNQIYTFENLILCTGSEPFIPSVRGLDQVSYWTHREALDAKSLPASIVVLGGGVIGMEFAAYFNALGVKVTVVEMFNEILGGMDRELAGLLRQEYARRGVEFRLQTWAVSVSATHEEGGIRMEVSGSEGETVLEADRLLVSAGRVPVTTGLGIEVLDLAHTGQGRIRVDATMRSSQPHIYVCGDMNGHSLLAHTAVREAEVAVHAILDKQDCMSYRAIPGVVYTQPEFAGVGATEEMLQAEGIEHQLVKLPMSYSGRFVAENEGVNGFCKLLIGTDGKILGAHVLGNPASEIIAQAGMAIELGLTVEAWRKVVVAHPTVGEIFKEALSQFTIY
ncbi:MAG: dihydrolipoyl dehydrogenase [Bacteroides sp.]|nr:dihydrolipoyl dehydrogenase [Bacteroides sp.]